MSLTADNVPLLIHDATLDRTSNVREVYPGRRPWPVADFTWQEIQTLDFGSWFARSDPFGQVAAGRVSREELARLKGEPAPSLAQALAFSKEWGLLVNLEIKDLSGRPGPDPAALVAGLVAEMGMLDRVLLSSFNHAYLRTIASLQPSLALGALVRNQEKDPVGLVRELGATSYHPRDNHISQAQIRDLVRAGIAVIPWTVNRPSRAKALFMAGASGIITDFPQLLALLASAPR